MTLDIAIQMDPIADIDIESDTTYVLAKEAEKRGHRLHYFEPKDISYMLGKVVAQCAELTFNDDNNNFYNLGTKQLKELSSMDVLLMRQDPPFNMEYITYTHLLDMVADDVLVINNPKSVRDCPEKLFVLKYPELMPPTLISQDREAILSFRAQYDDVILKPVHTHAGCDIFRVGSANTNLHAIIDVLLDKYNCPLIVQEFVKDISEGDKRIILIDGKPVGAVNRIPGEDEIRSNFSVGGTGHKTTLTERDLHICKTIEPDLKRLGLILVGIDVIGNYLTEINVTSPTGIQAINDLDNVKLEEQFWDVIDGLI